MIYQNIEEYLSVSNSSEPELWIFDSDFLKKVTLEKLPSNKAVSTSIDSFFSFLEKDNKKDILSEIEVKILIEKLISKNKELKFLDKQSSLLNGFIELLKFVRLYPSYDNKKLETNIRSTLKMIYDLYKTECEKNNFKDFASNLFELSKSNSPKKNNFNKLVLIGDFFHLSELHWKVLFNYLDKYQEIIFIGSSAEYISKFYQLKDYLVFNQNIKDFFQSDQENSLNNKIKNLTITDLKYKVYTDWEEEIDDIAYQIKDDQTNSLIDYSQVGIYIPDKIYHFKVAKIFNDYQIPFFTTFQDSLASHPLTKFFSFWLEMDWHTRKDIFKFLNSPFIQIDYSDYITKTQFDHDFLDININDIEITENTFNQRYLEEIMLKSGVDFLLFKDTVYKKIKAYFEKEAKFGMDKKERIAANYKTTISYLEYFYHKTDELKVLLPSTAYAKDFHQLIFKAIDYLKIEKNYLLNEVRSEYYQKFIDFLQDLSFYIAKVNNKKHSLNDYSNYIKTFSQSFNYKKTEEETGVMVTDSNYINKANLKRIYQVGLTSKLFPKQNESSIFSKVLADIFSHNEKDLQVLSLFEILQSRSNGNLEIFLSQPILVNNEENEKSEILVDLNIKDEKHQPIKQRKAYSTTEKITELLFNNSDLSANLQRMKEIHSHRGLNQWTKYEGHLENIIEEEIFSRQTSVTQIEEFAKCPMKYFFNRKLKIKAIREKTEDVEANVKGTIVHKILEQFYKKLIDEKTLEIPISEKQLIMLEISKEVFKDFETIYDNLYLDYIKYQFNTGLAGEKKKGILQNILESDQVNILAGWLPVKTEHRFSYELDGFKFQGSIDRIDEKNNHFQIIDYKSGGHDTTDDIKEGLAFQMPVYTMAYQNESGKETGQAAYYSMKKIDDIKPVVVMPEIKGKGKNAIQVGDNQTLMNIMTEHLAKIKSSIKKSQFNFTVNNPDTTCSYCDYSKSCHYDPEKIVLLQENNYQNNQYFEILSDDKFVFIPKDTKSSETGLTDEQKMALATDKNIIVTAGAGAGKTEVLTQRMINLLDNVKGDISKILVITFTKKATAEMQLRIYSSIVKKITDGQDTHGYYLKAKQNFADNRISTIDGFYMRLLKENSLDLKLDNELNISEKKEINELISQTIEKTIDDMAKERDEDLRKVLYVWSRKQIIEHCANLLDQFWIYDYLEGNALENFQQVYKQIIFNDINQHIITIEEILNSPDYNEQSGFPQKSKDALLNWKYEFIRLKENYDNYNKPNIDDAFKFTRIPKGFDKDLYQAAKENIATFETTLNTFDVAKLEKEYLFALINVLKKVEKKYQDKRKKDNINNFSDIAFLLYKMLKNNTNDIREKLKEKFTYIMIDEFQDTDQIQWEIAKYLSGWNGYNYSTMAKDKLFIVGDDKQSIYGFRGGDVKVFNQAKKEIVDINKIHSIDGGFIQFPDNFRSSANIIDFFNNFFSVLFSNSEKAYEAAHQNLKGHKQTGSINFFLFKSEKKDDSEPIFIAKQINAIIKANPSESIAILFRTKKNIPKFVKALENEKINYLVTGGRDFYQRPEIQDMYNVLAFLADQTKQIELIGFLRSAMTGLSDTEIYKIKADLNEGLKNYPEIYQTIYGKYENDILIQKGWKQSICDLPLHEMVIKIIDDTAYKSALSQYKDSVQRLKNIEKFIEICKKNEDMTLNEFIDFFEYQLNNNTDEANATILEMGDNKAVQLMTIHASKGLGFDTVIVADCNSQGKNTGSGETISYGDIEDFSGKFIGFKVPSEEKFDKENTTINNKVLDYVRAKEKAELKRLLYVALTRVKHNLIISATMKKNTDGFMKLFEQYFEDMTEISGEAFISKKIKDIDFHIFNCDFVNQ